MEPRFRHDFSQVRIHADARAAESARTVNAQAFTVGSQIVFDSGQFVPGTREGKNLLAHELTHVLQQTHGLTRSAPGGVGPVDDEHERQADAVAHVIVDVPGRVPAPAVKAEIPGTHQVATRNDTPPPPSRVRLQRKSDDEEESFDDETPGGSTKLGGTSGGSGATETKGCPKVPTHRGDDIPDPLCPTATHTGSNELKRFNFCLDSDELIDPAQLGEIQGTVNGLHRSTRYLIHGYASPEGRKDYNFRLACHRAIKIANAFREALKKRLRNPTLDEQMLNAEVESRIETASQGPTSEFGKPEENRVAVVFGQIPGQQDEEPECEKAPHKLGDIKPEFGCDVVKNNFDPTGTGEQLDRFHFCLDSDVLTEETPNDIRSFGHKQAASTNFIVHGFASLEGAVDYNQRLSCHRALRIFRELVNAGVKAEQITEVSGLGATKRFGEAKLNRVVAVLAEGGDIDAVPEGTRPANNRKQKEAVRDEALARLRAGKYELGADAYISFWTCGRTPTVRAAIERLTIQVKDNNAIEIAREDANGTEEGFGVNFVRLSNVALTADNAIECTMGRLIDMAFHHAVLNDPALPADLITPFDPNAREGTQGKDPKNKESRHQAGLHLIHLAGLGACAGAKAQARGTGLRLAGIDVPVSDDPRETLPPPSCAEAPQPTRLHPPAAGTKGRETPAFKVVGEPQFIRQRGKLINIEEKEKFSPADHILTKTDKGVLSASATVQLKGQPDTFKDYEVGFIQAVIADEAQANYDSGHSVIQKLPVPIRLAQIKQEPRVPAPWTALDAMKTPEPDGRVTVSTEGAKLNTESAVGLGLIRQMLPDAVLHTFEQDSSIAIWLAVRRRGAPLDRFSVRFLDGVVYNLLQSWHFEHRRIQGELHHRARDKQILVFERELPVVVGSFLSTKSSIVPEDPVSARFTSPVANEISLFDQVHEVVEAPAATESGMGTEDLKAVVAEILDNLELFEDEEKAKKKEGATKRPRLGFDFIPLTFTLPFVRRTGRLKTPGRREIVTQVNGPGLGVDAADALSEALEFRIRDRESEGKPVIMRPSAIPGGGETGDVTVRLEPLRRQPGDTRAETDLIKRPEVVKDMSDAWACTLFTKQNEARFGFSAREFGRSYAIDRQRGLHRDPTDHIKMGCPGDLSGSVGMNLPCPRPDEGSTPNDAVTMGGFHTHPEIVPKPGPTVEKDENGKNDLDFARECGSQAFIVTDFKAFRYFADERVDSPINLPQTTKCDPKNFEPDPQCKIKDEDF